MGKLSKIAVMTIGLSAIPAFAGGEICFRTQADATCRTATDLKAAGVETVRFTAQSLDRDDESTTWGLYAYRAGTPVALALQGLMAVIPQAFSGEDAVLGSQRQVCTALTQAGIACSRNLLDGSWTTYAAQPFTATFTQTSETPLASSGTFETRRWACSAGDTEKEIACKGTFYTSLRLLYLVNSTYLNLSDATCAETGAERPAVLEDLPGCAVDGIYDAADAMPIPMIGVQYVSSNAVRAHIQTTGTSLYRIGF